MIILGVIAIRMGAEGIRVKLIRYRKAPTDGHGNPLYEENLTGLAAVRAGWICVGLGVTLILIAALFLIGWVHF
jgi:hypothetical protein